MKKKLVERALEAEMNHELGYSKHDRGDKESIKAAKALLKGKRILDKNIIGFFNEKKSTNRKFVKRIAHKTCQRLKCTLVHS